MPLPIGPQASSEARGESRGLLVFIGAGQIVIEIAHRAVDIPAADAGFKVGDTLLAMGSMPVGGCHIKPLRMISAF